MLIHLEGNIASGKSTLGEALSQSDRFHFIPEPVNLWQTGFAINWLDRFYSDMPRWSFTFQMVAFTTRIQALADRPADRITIAERSIGTDRYAFAPGLHATGGMDDHEWALYCAFWDTMAPNVPAPNLILYLRTPADECLRRLRLRNRAEESGITLDYLRELEQRHDAWLLNRPDVIVLDGMHRWTADEITRELSQNGHV
ncbi:MAG: deoxynucleoside kinase [Anaerolineae bacterium]